MKKKIAITGGIGSGKSTVLKLLRSAGYACFSCDEIYNAVIVDQEYIAKIQTVFPSAVVNGTIDRKQLSDIVFADQDKRAILNEIAHKFIMRQLFAQMDECTHHTVFAEVPLLFEGDYQKQFDGVIVVMRHNEDRIQAVCDRDNTSRDDVRARIAAQYDYSQLESDGRKKDVPIYILKNDANIAELQSRLKIIVKHIS